jgi:hypothetical protein
VVEALNMSKTIGLWRGKPLEEYTKEELIEIVMEMGRQQREDMERHSRDMKLMVDLGDADYE